VTAIATRRWHPIANSWSNCRPWYYTDPGGASRGPFHVLLWARIQSKHLLAGRVQARTIDAVFKLKIAGDQQRRVNPSRLAALRVCRLGKASELG